MNLSSGSINSNDIKIRYVTVAEPGLKQADSRAFSGGWSYEGNTFHRWMLDNTRQSFFGYDLAVETAAGNQQCRVSILPLSMTASDIEKNGRSPIQAWWKPLNLPGYPSPQVVEPGDTIALDLLVSADKKQKIVDYFRASCGKDPARAVGEEKGPARDFTVQDVAMDISNANLYLNGQPVSGTPTVGDANGPIAWFYFPGKGRFLVSVAPREGYDFVKTATIRKNRISFEMGGARYEVRASHEILGNGSVWNAYVLFDEAYPTKGASAAMGGSDSVEKLLERR